MSPGPYKMGTIARLSGFSPELLRAWERRHDLLAPERGPGGQRLYGDDDVWVLGRIKALLDEGRSIGEIAQVGRARLLQDRPLGLAGVSAAAAGAAPDRAQTEAWRQRVVEAALALDSQTLKAALDEAFAAAGPERAIHGVIEPAAREIGVLWAEHKCNVASEHLASDLFTHRIRRLLDEAQPVLPSAPRAVAACFPDEPHQLGLLILSWHLSRRGFRVDYLGAALPLSDLAEACAAASPRAVLLSVTHKPMYQKHRKELARLLSRRSFRWPVYIGGQGAPDADPALPRGKTRIVGQDVDLSRTLEAITRTR